MRLLALVILAASAACDSADEVTLLEADPSRTGPRGAEGPFGVGRATRDLGTDAGTARTDVYRPLIEVGTAPRASALVFLQGGFVSPARYEWIARHVASRGSVALVPHHAFDLAFFSQDAAGHALAGARAVDEGDALFGLIDDGPALIAGHSLGGVVAAKAWLAIEDFGALALLASEPDSADDFSGRAGRVLSIVGSRDAKETVEKAEAGAAAFDGADVIVVEGMNHYQLTDDATDGELASDGVPGIDTEDAQALVLTFVDALLDDLAGRSPYALDDPSRWPSGTSPP